MTDFPILNGAPVVDILASAKRNALPPAEREAQDLCDAYAGAIAVILTEAIKSFPVPIGRGAAPAPRLVRNLADRIVGEISPAVLAAIEGEAKTTELQAALKLAISHINHMANWIGMTNRNEARGTYSFEGLGEDMPGIKAALLPPQD